ncbi:hypothetical protein F5B22DRAFT_4427 [Xylaria bambusicola]|uniref:uncharacterized protein n=1 Tax=Xylaria bambusicola TaxID=326684 RepID=UPI002008EAFA|nr:uncharacterized protein F5B22DRAFT_4427 [Xylaria bambusicola]KAI0527793.1 hypothetical protein F5B22DRAFT_4427 [Xylaria bambusicola]
MSSTTGLSRTRSVRNTAANGNDSTSKPAVGRNDARNASPSRLPMRPPTTRSTTSSTTASSSTTLTRARAPTSSTSRQVSGGSSAKAPSRATGPTTSSNNKPVVRAQSVRQPPSTTTTTASSGGIGRSISTARPRSSAGLPSKNPPRERHLGHSRAKSTVTSLTSATTLRPVSRVPSRSNPSPAPSTASSTSTSTQTTTTTSTRTQTRSQTQHARVGSQSSTTASTLAARRPAFNTNQQHYSPAKSSAPKPLTSTFLAPASPSKQPVNVALTAETSRLQTELLQLSLLHREAHAVTESWHASARSKLGARFQKLVIADEALRALERDGAEERGIQDLIRWGEAGPNSPQKGYRRISSTGGLPLDEKIRLLDQVLNGAWALGEPGGRYQRTVRAFEDWTLRVSEIRAAQRGGDLEGLLARSGGREEDVGIFVSDLDASAWKRDHAGLVRVLEGWRRTLVQLGDVESEDGGEGISKSLSGLARTLRGCKSLVHDMLAELQIMEQIEADALAAEEDWMGNMEDRMNSEGEAGSRRRRTEEVPPWKMLAL